MSADITVIDGVRYRTEDARARGLIDESTPEVASEEEIEARIAEGIAAAVDQAVSEATTAAQAAFEERVSAEVEKRLAALAEEAAGANTPPVEKTPAKRAAKTPPAE